MLSKELLKKVKLIELRTKKIINTLFAGEYHSAFKGRGMEFEEVREYSVGDDVRFIDWNVTARYNSPYIKVFREERELTVNLLVDISKSNFFGTANQLKFEKIAEIAAILAFSAIKNNDKVGLILFSDRIEKYIPPKKGRKHILYILREILYHNKENIKTDINSAVEFLLKVQKKKSAVFLFSDFISDNYEKSLQVASNKHDLISIVINDERELSLNNIGIIKLIDAETGKKIMIDTSNKEIINKFNENISNYIQARDGIFKKYAIDSIKILTNEAYEKKLINFFKKRM